MNTPTPKKAPILGVGIRWTPKFLESDCMGQKPIGLGVPCIIEKLLERRCLKWARMTHLDI
jgi:hypothetical protein